MQRIRGLMCAAALCAALGCAEGYQGIDGLGDLPGGDGLGSAGNGAAAGTSGAGMGGSAGSGSAPSGEPCRMGETQSCACATGGTGTRVCRFDRSSPTMGSFSPCQSCSMTGGNAGTGGGSAGAGTSGGSGTGGRAGMSGSSGTGGSGGTGGSLPPPPSGGDDEEPWCVFVPIPLPGLCQ